MHYVFLNGEYIKADEAKVSVFDRGFLFSDAVYEVIAVYNKRLFMLDAHLQRLYNSLDSIHLDIDPASLNIEEILYRLIEINEAVPVHQIYFQVSRGSYGQRQHNLPDIIRPTVLAFCMDHPPPTADELACGFTAITINDMRWKRCDIKTTGLLANILSARYAHTLNNHDAIFIHQGYAIEGTSSNLFIVKDGTIYTPPTAANLLAGITRAAIISVAGDAGIPLQERMISKDELLDSDEVWLTNTTKEVRPITQIDNHIIGNGQPGPMWSRIHQHFQTLK